MTLPAAASDPGLAADRYQNWELPGAPLCLDRPRVLGVLNTTPDSFSDGGLFLEPAAALARAERMIEEGADVIDVGGESTRPGAAAVPPRVQLERVVPVIEALARRHSVPVSIDTRSAAVARAALGAGAAIVNDVSGLSDPAMAEVVREHGAALVLMHMRGTPETMQSRVRYGDVVRDVRRELRLTLRRALDAGIPAERIVLDPGLGFAKRAAENLALLARLDELAELGRPLLVGPSRKSFIGELLGGAPPAARLAGTLAACVAALLRGARLFRVHDVAPVREALSVAESIRQAPNAQR